MLTKKYGGCPGSRVPSLCPPLIGLGSTLTNLNDTISMVDKENINLAHDGNSVAGEANVAAAGLNAASREVVGKRHWERSL